MKERKIFLEFRKEIRTLIEGGAVTVKNFKCLEGVWVSDEMLFS